MELGWSRDKTKAKRQVDDHLGQKRLSDTRGLGMCCFYPLLNPMQPKVKLWSFVPKESCFIETNRMTVRRNYNCPQIFMIFLLKHHMAVGLKKIDGPNFRFKSSQSHILTTLLLISHILSKKAMLRKIIQMPVIKIGC